MRVVVLSSGSKGNTTYVECGNTKILIDMGNTCKYVVEKLEKLGIKADELNGIFITHTHVDHVKGLKVFLKKYPVQVYCTEKMLIELDYIKDYCLISDDVVKIGDLSIDIIKTSHDVTDSVGFVINGSGKGIVYITDTGYINQRYFSLLENREVYILESNHDIEMLNNGPYSFNLRQRILGDKGHLSNYDCSRYLASLVGDKTKCIVLAHLSEENNTTELAYNTLIDRLGANNLEIESIIVAHQNEETGVILV